MPYYLMRCAFSPPHRVSARACVLWLSFLPGSTTCYGQIGKGVDYPPTHPPTYLPTYLPYLLYLYFHTFVLLLLLLLLLFISISISISISILLLLLLPHWEHTFPSLTLVNLIPGFSNI